MQFSCSACRRWRETGLLCSLLTAFWAKQMYRVSSVRKAQWRRRSAELCKRTSWGWASLDQLYFTLSPLSDRQCTSTGCPWHVPTDEPSNQTWGLLTASAIQTSITVLLKSFQHMLLVIIISKCGKTAEKEKARLYPGHNPMWKWIIIWVFSVEVKIKKVAFTEGKFLKDFDRTHIVKGKDLLLYFAYFHVCRSCWLAGFFSWKEFIKN